jgi:phosphatidylinositol-3-phosphatase
MRIFSQVLRRWTPLLLFIFLSTLAISFAPHPVMASTTSFDHVVTILMENHGINDTYNCGGNCAYITQLANNYGLAENYSALTHPSMANYIALTSGGQYGTGDVQPPGSVNATNIVDRLEAAGLTWKAYMESYHGGCSDFGSNYSDNHNPFVKYVDIYNNPGRCAKIVNTGNDAGNSSTSLFLSDLSSPSAPNYMWLTPNLCHDMHGCPVSAGDNYLANLVPQILSSYTFTHQRAALFITFDEGCCTFPSDRVTTIWAGPGVNLGYKSNVFYDHYSYLRTVEDNWGLPYLTVNDTSATPMNEFFGALTIPPEPQPLIYGWGGILATGSVHFNSANTASKAFPGEQASNTEVAFAEMRSRGYNGARVAIIDPGNQPDSSTYNSNAWHRTLSLAKYYGLYVIGDDHQYNITGSWLPFWRTVIQDTPQSTYPNVLWEAQNEPHDANLTTDFQSFINMDRGLGDTRWIVLGCNNSCTPTGTSDLSNFPIVNDSLNHIFYDFHEYYFYPDHSNQWNITAAVAFADSKIAGIQNVINTLHRPFLGTEWGAETGCYSCADQVIPGSAGYAPETLAYLKEIVTWSHQAGIGYTIWNAGDWNDAPAGTTGALDTFGQFLPLPNGTIIQPPPPPPPPKALFFAYGRDMLESVTAGYTGGTATFVDTARLDGYSFVIDHTGADGTGTAGIMANSTDFVEGVVYSLPQASLTLLDNSEGLNGSYQRINNFHVTSLTAGQALNVSVYTVISPEKSAPAPSKAYSSDVLNGIAEHGLGQTYSDKINLVLNPPPLPPPPPSKVLVFAYGRDMLASAFQGYTNNTATFVDTAQVNGYSFVIDNQLVNGTGSADIVVNGTDFVRGVVYSIPQSSLGLLDIAEGMNGYVRVDNFLVTSLTTGQVLNASIYKVISPVKSAPAPSQAYSSDVLNGIAQHNLGQDYSNKISLILNSPLPPPPLTLIGDVNHDDKVDLQDLVICLSNLGRTGPNACDLNNDGVVNLQDIIIILMNFGEHI